VTKSERGWPRDTNPRPTTKDLARVAGVSRATVDRVLNGREGVTQKTVERVNQAIADLGFVRNLEAANLAKSRNYRFIFVLPGSGGQFLEQIAQRIGEAAEVFAADRILCDVHYIDENDPHSISAFLSGLDPDLVTGVAIMVPESPQVRDAIIRVQEREIAAISFVTNQSGSEVDSVGIDNIAAGATAALLLGQCVGLQSGEVMVIAESMLSRDSLERRFGFDRELTASFPRLKALPSLETYGNELRAGDVINTMLNAHPDIVAAYVMSSEAQVPLELLKRHRMGADKVKIAHERTPFTEAALRDRSLDGLVAQDAGHLVRSAIRRLKGLADGRAHFGAQERIRIEVLLRTNL
jgi:LacI family transcriptional regulator